MSYYVLKADCTDQHQAGFSGLELWLRPHAQWSPPRGKKECFKLSGVRLILLIWFGFVSDFTGNHTEKLFLSHCYHKAWV